MERYDSFIFDSCELDVPAKTIRLRYALDDREAFEERILLPQDRPLPDPLPPELAAAIRTLHLMGGASYYKTACPKLIVVNTQALTADAAAFWNAVYEKGLGEFFYRNTIDFRGLIDFPAGTEATEPPRDAAPPKNRRVLVPVGGGKDSVVTAELLKAAHADITLFRMGAHPFIDALAAETGLPLLTVERRLSPRLFELNAQGALNGHVPITGYLSALTAVLALLYGFDTVALSNERSANEGNVDYLGSEINHQWSKSVEFERAFAGYLRANVTRSVTVFSLLRPLSELTIAKLFAQSGKYRTTVTSCNANWRILGERPAERWCGTCPKCLFAFVLFSAFLNRAELEEMFTRNLLEDESLLPLFRELLGLQGFKPFECVGTPEETVAALTMAHRRGDLDASPLMQAFLAEPRAAADADEAIRRSLALSDDHLVPADLLPLLHAAR